VDDKTVFGPASGGSVRRGAQLNGIYEVETLIAQGGMGEVYQGFNIQTRDLVAIKMIRPEMSSHPDALALFRREASTLHNLQHDAIVRYFVFSVDPNLQRAYLAMEFVDGPSLTKRLASGPLPLAEVRILQERIGGALDAAHRLGVVHRDISSDNVILPGGDVRRAKIIDFGIARSTRPGEGTIIGDGFAGKYNYVSPEQLGLYGGDVTFKSDIYSFGLVLAEALRGQPIDMNGSQADVIEKRRTVPDLSGVDVAMRPLLQAMLQPLPANRPVSMADVAAWRPGKRAESGAADVQRPRASSGGRAALIVAGLIVVVSLAGTAYVFRDDIAQSLKPSLAPPTPSAVSTGLPQLAPPSSTSGGLPQLTSPSPAALETPAGGGSTSVANPPGPTPTPTASATTSPHVPTSQELVDALPPRAPQTLFALPPAVIGKPYRADLPAFADPGGHGLRLKVDAPPDGLTFKDLGDGRGEIAGAPTRAGNANVLVMAVNRDGRTAQMTATISIADLPAAPATTPTSAAPTPVASAPLASPSQLASTPSPATPTVSPPVVSPPRPSQPQVVLEGATVGDDYSSALPPFNVGANARGLALHAEPNPPEGLSFADLGSGLSQISGRPVQPGAFAFDIVATNGGGLSARMGVKMVIAAPAPPPTLTSTAAPTAPTSEPTVVAALTPSDKASAFIKVFDGGACFLIRPRPGAVDDRALQGVGAELAPFQRFDAGYTRDVGVEPQLGVRLIAAPECPAVDLIRLGTANGGVAPRIELTNYDVGRGKPLMGTVSRLAGRRLALLLVDNDGVAHRLETKMLPGGDSATFNVPLVADAASIGPLQIVIAIASTKPIAALDALRSSPLKELAPRLLGEAPASAVAVEAEFFKLVN
jgi:serine/threonine-protein kinase